MTPTITKRLKGALGKTREARQTLSIAAKALKPSQRVELLTVLKELAQSAELLLRLGQIELGSALPTALPPDPIDPSLARKKPTPPKDEGGHPVVAVVQPGEIQVALESELEETRRRYGGDRGAVRAGGLDSAVFWRGKR